MHKLNERWKIDVAEYADDFSFLSESKEVLRQVLDFIREEFADLHLTLKGNYQIFRVADNRFDKHGRAIDFVGYKFFRKQKLMRKGIKQNFCRAVAKLNAEKPVKELKPYKQAVAPWLGWAKHSNSRNLLRTIIYPSYYESIL